MTQTLVRKRNDKIIAGVCAGIAQRFGMSPSTVRLLFVLSIFLPGPQLLVYLVMWVAIPLEPEAGAAGQAPAPTSPPPPPA